MIQKLAESTIFKKFTGNGVKVDRIRNHYLVLRLMAFYSLIGGNLPGIEFHSDIDAFLTSVTEFINIEIDDEVIDSAEKTYLRGIRNVFQAVRPEAFRLTSKTGAEKRPISVELSEALIMMFSQVKLDLLPENIDLHDLIEQYKKGFDDIGIFSGAIGTAKYIDM